MCDSWAAILSELSEGHGPRIARLSKELPPDEALMVYQWVREFTFTCELLERTLNDTGVMEAAEPWLERVRNGEPMPVDTRRAVSGLHREWTRLFAEAEPVAHDWVKSQLDRPEVRERSERIGRLSAESPVAQDSGVTDINEYRERREVGKPNSPPDRSFTTG